ncbi:hypothetical protein [Pseudomonas sp. BF-R-24]|uniref:hypothetical protein n=1 Tax=Pseudomonas sp. BF-R-24 TaxID=2832386 RepID=UPI003989F2EF
MWSVKNQVAMHVQNGDDPSYSRWMYGSFFLEASQASIAVPPSSTISLSSSANWGWRNMMNVQFRVLSAGSSTSRRIRLPLIFAFLSIFSACL